MKGEERSTEEVLKHHLDTFAAGDVDGLLVDYSDDSKLYTPDGVISGVENLRPLYSDFTTKILPPGSEIEILKKEVDGELAYIVWKAKSKTHQFHIGTDTFIIRNGKIVTQTYAGHVEELG